MIFIKSVLLGILIFVTIRILRNELDSDFSPELELENPIHYHILVFAVSVIWAFVILG